jgi:hypothetical protein
VSDLLASTLAEVPALAAAEREAIEAQAERVDSARDEPWSPE